MLVIVAYDISDDRRRDKLHDTLKRFGVHVQKSVVECWLEPRELPQLKQAILEVIIEHTDEVRLYCLCEFCLRRTKVTPASRMTSDPQAIFV
jgi:CRISPR-associated protein Cas2